MMTPVENGSTSCAAQPSSRATAAQQARASAMPRLPVPALALPALISRARVVAVPRARCSRQTITGAAQKRFCVNTPAAASAGIEADQEHIVARPVLDAAGGGAERDAGNRQQLLGRGRNVVDRHGRAERKRRPDSTAANRARRRDAADPRGSSAMRPWSPVAPYDRLDRAVAVLEFLARSAGAGIVAADFLPGARERRRRRRAACPAPRPAPYRNRCAGIARWMTAGASSTACTSCSERTCTVSTILTTSCLIRSSMSENSSNDSRLYSCFGFFCA